MNRNTLRRQAVAPQRDTYNKKDTRIEYQLYGQEYFSGADMHIYFGDIWVDEITDLTFHLKEEILPIFGYNSYTFDALARGRRQIEGQFSMNFKSVGYLQQILENANAIEHAIEKANSTHPTVQYYKKYKLDEILSLYGKESFDQIAEEYENEIWGEGRETDRRELSNPTRPYFQRDNKEGFDIRINYGAVEETLQDTRHYRTSNKPQPNLTVERINGVHIFSMGKSAGTQQQGAPIQETYSFIAQDLNSPSNSV